VHPAGPQTLKMFILNCFLEVVMPENCSNFISLETTSPPPSADKTNAIYTHNSPDKTNSIYTELIFQDSAPI
jgi:hypothetical protein